MASAKVPAEEPWTVGMTHSSTRSSSQRSADGHEQHHPPHNGRNRVGLRLFGRVTLLQDWDQQAEEVTPEYWELFTDLVAAASSIADGFQEKLDWIGLWEFTVLYSALIHGWLLYTHHYTSRFREPSLFHSVVFLFSYLLGMAGTVVNASVETASAFSWGILVQRGAFVLMMLQVAIHLPRAQWFSGVLSSIVGVTMILFLITALYDTGGDVGRDEDGPNGSDKNNNTNPPTTYEMDLTVRAATEDKAEDQAIQLTHHQLVTLIIWTVAAVVDFGTEMIMMLSLTKARVVPMNIDHTKDRLGILVLVMMGETVISATILYRDHVESGIDAKTNEELYQVLVVSFLLVFISTLLYFHIQPNSEDHAFRRSRFLGWLCYVLSKVLCGTFLMIGVYIKLAVSAVAHHTTVPLFGQGLLTFAVGGSLTLMLGVRLCHYGGRMPNSSHPLHVQRLMWSWWIFIGMACIFPFFFGRLFPNLYNTTTGSPIPPLLVSSLWVTGVCIFDSSCIHYLEAKYMQINSEADGNDENHPTTEETALVHHSPHVMAQASFYVGSERATTPT